MFFHIIFTNKQCVCLADRRHGFVYECYDIERHYSVSLLII